MICAASDRRPFFFEFGVEEFLSSLRWRSAKRRRRSALSSSSSLSGILGLSALGNVTCKPFPTSDPLPASPEAQDCVASVPWLLALSSMSSLAASC